MATHYKWYPSSEDVVVPFNARYNFPDQATKAVKITPRIPPKNGATFTPGSVIRLEFPAQGYINPLNTTLEFDVNLYTYGTPTNSFVRFQNNIQSVFSRARLLYGATPLEDIINYNVIMRALTEWTATNQTGSLDQTSIAEGIGGVVMATTKAGYYKLDLDSGGTNTYKTWYGPVNVRQAYIQGVDTLSTFGFGYVPNGAGTAGTCVRRYQVNFGFGLFNQDKLLPVKFMASQLAIELTLAPPASCIMANVGGASGTTPTYDITNVNLIPEILEFDSSYDAMFLKGLREGGVPIKFSSWHTFIFNIGNQQNVNLLVQERSRSVKALFAVQRRAPEQLYADAGALFFDTSATTLQSYQFRIGGRFFPAAPVQCSTAVGGSTNNGGAEAYIELEKALKIVGDYRLSTGLNTLRWAVTGGTTTVDATNPIYAGEADYQTFTGSFGSTGNTTPIFIPGTHAANMGSTAFAMAIDLETTNGVEISGLNAEEQSDISLMATYAGPQLAGYNMEVYALVDMMIVLRENNVIELIQ